MAAPLTKTAHPSKGNIWANMHWTEFFQNHPICSPLGRKQIKPAQKGSCKQLSSTRRDPQTSGACEHRGPLPFSSIHFQWR